MLKKEPAPQVYDLIQNAFAALNDLFCFNLGFELKGSDRFKTKNATRRVAFLFGGEWGIDRNRF
ncbi:hypothetical protein [Pedobacter cryoconitis]|uniref:Uncharacterized protein n=1 Tax=Pedobacter cryoconitis TaxID=188932 RepID=A0A327SVZ3_9SPHI|nr:hypothetical protein [Pedobacter cryoconitis]RAJ33098.1 hypothetical protein LY11_01788 [Pedobacter cryoconitis]